MAVFFLVIGLLPPLAQAAPNGATGPIPITQELTVRGIVTDFKGVPIPGAHVQLKAGGQGTVTAEDGRFTLTAGPHDSLIFSALGFITQTVVLGRRQEITIRLEEAVTELEEAVVNAGYYKVSEKERTGSIVKVEAEDIQKQPVSNPIAALQGRMAGVEVVQTSGVTGSVFTIRIRGRNSIRPDGNQPLFLIDGVPYSTTSLGESQSSASVIPGGAISPLNNINPSDIERIEVLKDADATAIYGSRGANGVVLITTKRGESGQARVGLEITTGLGSVSNTLDLLSTPEYLLMRREAYENDGVSPLPFNAYDVNGTWNPSRETDWQKVLFGKTSYLTNLRGSLSGGTANTGFLLSGTYHRQTNVFPGDFENDKVSALANLHHRSNNDRLSVQFSAAYTSNRNNLPATGLVLSAISLAPNAPELYQEDGSLNWENSTWTNPLRHLEGIYESNATNLLTNTSLSYRILRSLRLTANLGYTMDQLREIKTTPSSIYDPAYNVGPEFSNAIHNVSSRNSWIAEPQLHFDQDFGSTRLEVLAGLTFQEQRDIGLSQLALGFTSNSLIENIAAASDILVLRDTDWKYRYQALFGRINLNHKGKYILNVTGRRDGSSRFGPDKRFADFGAVGLAWIFSEEALFSRNSGFLSFGKIRASYGTSGNDQIGDYQYLDTYSFGSLQYQNVVGLYPTRLFNPEFSWETNKKLEFALDLGFIRDRIMISGNYFRNRSSNQLVGIPLPGTTGFSTINANLDATVENSGWEFMLNTVNIKNEKWEWTTSLNLTIPRNKLLAFPNLEGSTYANQLVIGKPLNIVKLYRLTGVDSETGFYQFEDFNEDGVISAPDDRQVIRDLTPEYYGGMNNSISRGRFKFDVLLQFSKQLGINSWETGGIPGSMRNQPTAVLDRWRAPGDEARFQKFSTGQTPESFQAYTNFAQSDATVSDASYLRIKTLSLSYEVANREKDAFGCEVYLQGQNLWTWTRYTGLDPETRSLSTVPVLRFFSLGTRLTF